MKKLYFVCAVIIVLSLFANQFAIAAIFCAACVGIAYKVNKDKKHKE